MQNEKCKSDGYASFCILYFALCTGDLFLDRVLVDVLPVTRNGTSPRGHRISKSSAPRKQSSEVLLDLRVVGELLDRGHQVLLRFVEAAAPEVCPSQAIEIRTVVGIFFQRALHQLNGFVELLAANSQQV